MRRRIRPDRQFERIRRRSQNLDDHRLRPKHPQRRPNRHARVGPFADVGQFGRAEQDAPLARTGGESIAANRKGRIVFGRKAAAARIVARGDARAGDRREAARRHRPVEEPHQIVAAHDAVRAEADNRVSVELVAVEFLREGQAVTAQQAEWTEKEIRHPPRIERRAAIVGLDVLLRRARLIGDVRAAPSEREEGALRIEPPDARPHDRRPAAVVDMVVRGGRGEGHVVERLERNVEAEIQLDER